MNEEESKNAQRRRSIERQIWRLRERHERQRLNLVTLEAAYNLLGAEIQRAEEELAKAG